MRPQRIKRILKVTLRKLGLEKRIRECAILSFWDEAVGENIALHTKPLKVYNGKMTVMVESPSWTQELSFLKNRIMESLNKSIGREVVKDIYFKVGKVERPLPEEREERIDLESVKLDRKKIEKIREYIGKISDPDIKNILKNFLTKEAKYEQIRDKQEV